MVITRLIRHKGTTLTELMIVVAILGIVAMVAPRIIINISRFTHLSSAQLETQRGARDSLSQINRNLRQAISSSIVVSQESGQPPYSSISFSCIDGRNMKYFQNGDKLCLSVDGSTSVVSPNLRVISFTYPRTDDSSIVSVSLTFEKATYEGATKALQMAIEKVRIMN